MYEKNRKINIKRFIIVVITFILLIVIFTFIITMIVNLIKGLINKKNINDIDLVIVDMTLRNVILEVKICLFIIQ